MKVRVPDGRIVEFPDDMPREEIKAFIAKKFPNVNSTQSNTDEVMQVAGEKVDRHNKVKDRAALAALTGIADIPTFGFSDELARLIDEKLSFDMAQTKDDPAYYAGMGLGTLANLAGPSIPSMLSKAPKSVQTASKFIPTPGNIQNAGTAYSAKILQAAKDGSTMGRGTQIKRYLADTIAPSTLTGMLYGAGDPAQGMDRVESAATGGLLGMLAPVAIKGAGQASAYGATILNELMDNPAFAKYISRNMSSLHAGGQLERTGDPALDKFLEENRHLFQGLGGVPRDLQKDINSRSPKDIKTILTELGDGNATRGIKEIRTNTDSSRMVAQNGRSQDVLNAIEELRNVTSSPRKDVYPLMDVSRKPYNPFDILKEAEKKTLSDITPSLGVKPNRGESSFVEGKVKQLSKQLKTEFTQEYGIPVSGINRLPEKSLQQLDDWIGQKTKSMIREEPGLSTPDGRRTQLGDIMTNLGINLQSTLRNTAKSNPYLSNEGRAFHKAQTEVAPIMDAISGGPKDIRGKIKGAYESHVTEHNKTAPKGMELEMEAHPTDQLHTVMTKRGGIMNKEFNRGLDTLLDRPQTINDLIESIGAKPSFDLGKFSKAKQSLTEQEIANALREYSPGKIGVPYGSQHSSPVYTTTEWAKKVLKAPEYDNYLMTRMEGTPVFKESLSEYLQGKGKIGNSLSKVAKGFDDPKANRMAGRNLALESLKHWLLESGKGKPNEE
jgi:hypothetical protein